MNEQETRTVRPGRPLPVIPINGPRLGKKERREKVDSNIPAMTAREEVIEIYHLEYPIFLNENIYLFKDKSRGMDLKEVMEQQFFKNNNQQINLGYNNDADWLKITLNTNHIRNPHFVLKIDKLMIDTVTFFYFNKRLGEWQYELNGPPC